MASIKRRKDRGNKWQARYRDPSGKEHAQLFDRKVDGENWLTSVTADILKGTYVDPNAGKATVREYAETWLERMTPTWRATTAGTVTNSIERHVLPVLGDRRVSSLRKTDVEALCASLGLSAATVGTVHQHLSQMLASAVEDGLIPRNPASRARLPKRELPRVQPIAPAVIAKIAAALPDWLKVAVPLGIGVGLRQGEMSGLTVDRLDMLRKTLRVDRQLVDRHVEVPTHAPVKTASSNRTVPLAQFVVDALADHLARFPTDTADFVVRDPEGRPVNSSRFGYPWRAACKAAGVDGLGYHSLRHTFASTLLSRGVSVKAVADWLGHSSPVITLQTYAHLMPRDEEVARSVLDAALSPSADQARTTEAADTA